MKRENAVVLFASLAILPGLFFLTHRLHPIPPIYIIDSLCCRYVKGLVPLLPEKDSTWSFHACAIVGNSGVVLLKDNGEARFPLKNGSDDGIIWGAVSNAFSPCMAFAITSYRK